MLNDLKTTLMRDPKLSFGHGITKAGLPLLRLCKDKNFVTSILSLEFCFSLHWL